MTIAELRREYTLSGLTEAEAGDDPILFFGTWFHAALAANLPEPNAMTLATASASGAPSARIVLLKQFDHSGFCFFTNYRGRKAKEIDANAHAALVCYWPEFERQVRIEGSAQRTSDAESDAYWASRPRGSKLGAWASPQSEVIAGRAEMDSRAAKLAELYPGDDIPRPPFWGGYRVVPSVIEFWQGRPSRLHDRLRFTQQTDSTWLRERLAP